MKLPILTILFWIALILPATAQHEGHQQQQQDTTQQMQQGHQQHGQMHQQEMPKSHAFSRNLSMTRNASGTGWLPDESPMYGNMFHAKEWMFMLHYNVFFHYNKQDVFKSGQRGDSQFDVPNWFILMEQRPVGARGLFRFSAMISLDPLTVGGSGYPICTS